MNHNRPVAFAVRSDIFCLKAHRKLEVQLNGSALPGSSERIRQMEINLRSVERAVPFIYRIIQLQFIQRLSQSVRCHFPVLIASDAVLGPGGQLHMITESKLLIDLINQPYNPLDFIRNLLLSHEDMRIILRKAAHAHQSVQSAGLLMTVYQSQLPDPKRKIPVGMRLGLVHQHPARTVHRLNREVFVIDSGRIHIFPIMIPMSGGLPKLPVQQHRGLNLHISFPLMQLSPVIDQEVLKNHSLGKEERESRPLIHQGEQSELFSKLPVIPLLRLLKQLQIFLQFFLLRERGSVDSGKHLILLASSPVCARNRCQPECLH